MRIAPLKRLIYPLLLGVLTTPAAAYQEIEGIVAVDDILDRALPPQARRKRRKV